MIFNITRTVPTKLILMQKYYLRSTATVLLAAANLYTFSAFADSLPLYCKYPPARGLRDDQQKICSAAQVPTAENKTALKIEEPKPVEVKYPLFFQGALLVEGKQPLSVAGQAKSNQLLLLSYQKDGNKDISIQTSDIIQWAKGDFSGKRFDGGSAVAGMGMMVGAAAITVATGGLGAPLMLLAAPFIGLSSGNTYVTDQRLLIRYIDTETGKIDYHTLQLFDKQTFLSVSEVIKTGSGLTIGKKRDDSQIKPLREKALLAQESKLSTLTASLMVFNRKKPWCSQLDLSGKTADTTEYKTVLDNISTLRKVLGMSEYVVDETRSSQERWDKYLDQNPGIKIWAATNKVASEKLKMCS